jgi:crossover junction endodeoxyribonuclease RusA
VRIVLPFPPSDLFPNKANGKHWSSTRAIKDGYRDTAFYLTKQAGQLSAFFVLDGRDESVPMKITFVQPDNRHRDVDNMLAAAKHALDGVAKALGLDDRVFRPIVVNWTREKGAGALIVEL